MPLSKIARLAGQSRDRNEELGHPGHVALQSHRHIAPALSDGLTAFLPLSQHPVAPGPGDARSDSLEFNPTCNALEALQFLQSAFAATFSKPFCKSQLCVELPLAKLCANPIGGCLPFSWTIVLGDTQHNLSIRFVERVAMQNLSNFAQYVLSSPAGILNGRTPIWETLRNGFDKRCQV